MLFSFFNKPYIKLDFYTSDPDVFRNSPVTLSQKNKPEWWKGLIKRPNPESPLNLVPERNMTHCMGFNKLFSNAINLNLWSDLNIRVAKIGDASWAYEFSDRKSTIDIHEPKQHGNFFETDKIQQMKLRFPWMVKCSESLNFLYTNALWYEKNIFDYFVPNAMMDYKEGGALHINIMIRKSLEDKTLELKHGMPLAMLIPITKKAVRIKCHLVTELEIKKLNSGSQTTKFIGSGYHNQKCPFNF